MGGGSMFRGMARLMGAATVGAVTVAAPPSAAFCHVSSSSKQQELSSSLNLAQKEACSASTLPSKPLVGARLDGADDWECPADEEWIERPRNHLVFAPAPTEEEVEEATQELHAALHLSIPVSGSVLEGSSPISSLCVPGSTSFNKHIQKVNAVEAGQEVADLSPKSCSIYPTTFAGRSSSVYQAFHLLQTNPQVQGAVKSLACDPAVWEAVWNNEKVQELTQFLQENDGTPSYIKSEAIKDQSKQPNSCLKFITKVYNHVTGKVVQFMDNIVDIVSSMFGSVEKTLFGKKGSDTVDKTVASCMMLAVAVLLVVVIKRVAIK